MVRLATLVLTFALAACGQTDSVRRTAGPAPDPLTVSVVNGPLMTDTTLSYASNADAVRPPDMPPSILIPAIDVVPSGVVGDAPPLPEPSADCPDCVVARSALTLDTLLARQADPRARACVPALGYSALWATRLPRDLPLPASARVIEAAGGDGAACHARAVAYGVAEPLAAFLAFERARLIGAGMAIDYRVDGDIHALLGRRARDGVRVALFATAQGGITDVRFVLSSD